MIQSTAAILCHDRALRAAVAFVVASFCFVLVLEARAETISGALENAYLRNPTLGSARAAVRAADEGVSQANAALRPRITGDALVGGGYERGIDIDGPVRGPSIPRVGGLTAAQNLFDGNRRLNTVRQAETGVFTLREALRRVEQQVLRDAATAYMNVLRDTAIVELEANNIAVLREQLRHTRDFYQGGYVSPTDVAQAAAALTLARADYAVARSGLQSAIAEYRRIVGDDPHRLDAARPIDALLPRSLEEAVRIATTEAPSVAVASHEVDAAALQVQLEEGRLYPTVDTIARAEATRDSQGSLGEEVSRGDHVVSAVTALRAGIPIYSGGETEAAVRRAKEILAQARLRVDVERRLVRARLESAWARLRAAREMIFSTRAAIEASASALSSVREEAAAGKRTTLDVLRTQRDLLRARVDLVGAQRDVVVLGYDVMAEVGWLSPSRLGLPVAPRDPTVHFDQVKDKWIGLRTSDGR